MKKILLLIFCFLFLPTTTYGQFLFPSTDINTRLKADIEQTGSNAGKWKQVSFADGLILRGTPANARSDLGLVGAQVSIPASGSSTVSTGLTTVSYAVSSLYTLDSNHGGISLSWSGGNVTITLYAVGSTTVSSAIGTASYFAVGVP